VAASELVDGPDRRLERYAELGVRVGANVERGQLVAVLSQVEHAPLARAFARAAYRAGARYVEVLYLDRHVTRALIEHGAEDQLSHTPGWLVTWLRELGEAHGALLATTGEAEPTLFADLDPARVGKARMIELAQTSLANLNARLTNWSGMAFPNEGWARTIFGEPDVERLWDAVAHATRLDEADPVAAWEKHMERLERRAAQLNSLGVDLLRYRGPGTDLTIGLLPQSLWGAARFTTAWGCQHVPNMPTEEVFTTPDARRTEGRVRSTRPLVISGTTVTGLEVEFEAGRAVHVEAESGAEVVRGQMKTDEQAPFLGEVALVDGTSRVGQTGLTFYDTLFDENATCHIAYGAGIGFGIEGELDGLEGFNVSTVHTDFMVGGPEVEVDAVTQEGHVVPLLREDVWQLD